MQSMKHWQELLFVTVGLSILGFIFSVNAQPRMTEISAHLEKGEALLPTESLVVNFMEIVDPSVEKYIKIEPQIDVKMNWSADHRSIIITPQKEWQTGKKYLLKIIDGRSGSDGIVSASLSFYTLAFPKLKSFTPEDGAKDVVVDIEDPVTANFDLPIDDFFTKIVITPQEEITYQRNDDHHSISFLATNQFKEGQHYTAELYLKHKDESDERYQKILSSSFDTKSPPPKGVAPDKIDRISEAKNNTKPQIVQGKYIDISLKAQVMVIFENGVALDGYLVSSGKRGMETPQGSFQIYNKFPRAWSQAYGLFMPFWMAILPTGKVGIHELPEWPNGYKEGQNHLGTPVSHGCVRLGVGAAERVYNWAEIGTPVIVHQ